MDKESESMNSAKKTASESDSDEEGEISLITNFIEQFQTCIFECKYFDSKRKQMDEHECQEYSWR